MVELARELIKLQESVAYQLVVIELQWCELKLHEPWQAWELRVFPLPFPPCPVIVITTKHAARQSAVRSSIPSSSHFVGLTLPDTGWREHRECASEASIPTLTL